MQGMEPVAIVTVLILAQYFWFSILVGKTRIAHDVPAPAVIGNAIFERYFRIHQNTLEQLVVIVPVMWLAKRGLGFIIGSLAQTALLLGALIGPILSWFSA